MNVVPIDPGNYGGLSAEIGRIKGYMNKDCSMTAVHCSWRTIRPRRSTGFSMTSSGIERCIE